MIAIFDANAEDFTGNGLGLLMPTTLEVDWALGGDYDVHMIHPIDATGKWERIAEGRILRIPVPAAMTPEVNLMPAADPVDIWRIHTNGSRLTLRAKPAQNGKAIAYYKNGSTVIVQSTSGGWASVITPDGKKGYMSTQWMRFDHTEGSKAEAEAEVLEPRPLRDQPFRIYRVIPQLNCVEVYAKHLFYDLLDNTIHKIGVSTKNHTGAQVLQSMMQVGSSSGGWTGCMNAHDFTAYSDIDATLDEEWELLDKNPVDALLGSEGFAERYGAELARDWYDIYMVKRVGRDTDVVIREGKNIKSASYDIDWTSIKTKLIPVGLTKDGDPMYLPGAEPWVLSPHVDDYPHPKNYVFDVSSARVDKNKTANQCYTEMRQACQDLLDQGCDLPTGTLEVDFVNLSDVEEYRNYAPLQTIAGGDSVMVVLKRIATPMRMRLVRYTWDGIAEKYTRMILGTDVGDLSGTLISPTQIGSRSISGSKIAVNAVGSGNLAGEAITARHISADSINTEALQAEAVTTVKLAAGAVTANTIAAGAVTTSKLDAGAVTAAKLDAGAVTADAIAADAVTAGKIAAGAITADGAEIAAAAIKTANIQTGAITTALIAESAVETSQIADASITDAKIVGLTANKITAGTINGNTVNVTNLNADNITAGTINGQRIPVLGSEKIADGAISGVKIENGAVTTTKLGDSVVTADKIVAGAVTSGKIASEAVTANHIAANTITGDKIAAATIEGENIKANTITANKLAADVGASLDLSSNVSVNVLITRASDDLAESMVAMNDNTVGMIADTRETVETMQPVLQNVTQSFSFNMDGIRTQRKNADGTPATIYSTLVSDVGFDVEQEGEPIWRSARGAQYGEIINFIKPNAVAGGYISMRRAADGGVIFVAMEV